MPTTHPRGAAGQAAAELTALVAVIALMVAALAVWLPGQRLGEPPQVIPQAARALRDGGDLHSGIPSVRALLRSAERNDPVDRFARWLDRGGGWFRAIPFNRAGIEVLRGARDELRAQLEAALDDPVGFGKGVLTPPSLDDLRALASGAGRLPDYIRELRAMDPDDAVMRLSHDTGRLAARAGIVWVRHRIGREVLRRAGRSPPQDERPARAP